MRGPVVLVVCAALAACDAGASVAPRLGADAARADAAPTDAAPTDAVSDGHGDAASPSPDAGAPSDVDAAVGPGDAGPDPFAVPLVLDDDRLRGLDPGQLFQADQPCRAPVLARVQYAVDGDTLAVMVEGGRAERIRMIGVNAPEIAHGAGDTDQCSGPEAHDLTRALAGHLVWLTFDRLCLDPYDRTLAFVHVSEGPAGIWERRMVRQGLGRAYIIGRNRALEADITADEALARQARAGLWGACP